MDPNNGMNEVVNSYSKVDPKIKRSAYAAQMLLASYYDEMVCYFQL